MKNCVLSAFLFFGIVCFGFGQSLVQVEIDPLTNLDTFYVEVKVKDLGKNQTIYQFASTAPGTYQTMNIGRYVSNFKALDKKGKPIAVNRVSVNQFSLSKPKKVATISYSVAETFDTRVEEYPIYPMAGSSIEDDHVLLNAHTVIGYFEGGQKSAYHLNVLSKPNWVLATPLSGENGIYKAESYDHLVDSPLLLGNLTSASTMVENTKVEIYCYAQQNKIVAESLLIHMEDMLRATKEFLIELPVERYTFLYHFEPNTPSPSGAWEHSYSSTYTLPESDFKESDIAAIADIASHEFFHIVTPLNIHSEVVESFNFVAPTPSKHLWLYEGVTEWASNILLMRAGVVDEQTYMAMSVAQKIMANESYFDPTISLGQLAETSFTPEGAKQYANIYYKGAMVAFLLDIELLTLSEGKEGLRALLLALMERYGKGKPVPEEGFIDVIAEMTDKRIASFFERYVFGSDPLPYEEYLNRIGYGVQKEGNKVTVLPLENRTPEQETFYLRWKSN